MFGVLYNERQLILLTICTMSKLFKRWTTQRVVSLEYLNEGNNFIFINNRYQSSGDVCMNKNSEEPQ